MLNIDFSKYEGTWVRIHDYDGNVWQGWVQFVEYPDETDDGMWSLGFENMLLNGHRTQIEILDQPDIKSIEIIQRNWVLGYRQYRNLVEKTTGIHIDPTVN